MPRTLVLSVGSDPRVLDTRELVLRSAGYSVVSAISIKEAVFLFKDGDFDIIILCHTFPMRDCERLTCAVRATGSRIPIGCVCGAAPGEKNPFADGMLDREPDAFLRGLEQLKSKFARVPSF